MPLLIMNDGFPILSLTHNRIFRRNIVPTDATQPNCNLWLWRMDSKIICAQSVLSNYLLENPNSRSARFHSIQISTMHFNSIRLSVGYNSAHFCRKLVFSFIFSNSRRWARYNFVVFELHCGQSLCPIFGRSVSLLILICWWSSTGVSFATIYTLRSMFVS